MFEQQERRRSSVNSRKIASVDFKKKKEKRGERGRERERERERGENETEVILHVGHVGTSAFVGQFIIVKRKKESE